MPRAFLIKKKLGVKCPSERPPKKMWTSTWIDSEMDADEDDTSSDDHLPLAEKAPLDGKGPYDLSVRARENPETMAVTDMNIEDEVLRHRPLNTVGIVAPKPIKPEPKSAEGITVKSSWQHHMYTPYLALNHPSYLNPARPDIYAMNNNGYFVAQNQAIVSQPLVTMATPTAPGMLNRERYSPTIERYSTYSVPTREGPSPPAKPSSPLPPSAYSGWISDGQDSGLASSPSPSSEDGDLNSRQSAPTRYQCPDCNKSYSTYSGLSKHRLMHCTTEVKKSFSCKQCDKVYVSLGALKMHIRTHTLPCRCSTCGKAFSRPWLLQCHIRTHTGEKPFSCQHCSRAFADRSNLRAHLQTHSHIKKYRCKTCSKTFSRMSLLLKHEDGGCSGAPVQ